MKQTFFDVEINTPGKALVDISDRIQVEIDAHELKFGLLTIWCTHTGASLIVQANADPDVAADILSLMEELVPMGRGKYQHKPRDEDNAPSHLRALLTQTQISVPIEDGEMPLGNVQSLFLFEHREAAKTRKLRLHFMGE